MKTYISKPIPIKAELFNPDMIEEYNKMWANIYRKTSMAWPEYYVKTLEWVMRITINDYLICGTEWEFYPCEKEIFEKKYITDYLVSDYLS